MNKAFHVYRTGRTFGVFVQPGADGTGQTLVEGGFFSKHAAEAAAGRWSRDFPQTTGEERHQDKLVNYDKETR